MSTILLQITVGVLVLLVVRSIDPPPLLHTGKSSRIKLTNLLSNIGIRLYGGYNNISYPNNSMIPTNDFYRDDPNNDGLNDALWCQSARNKLNIGVWYHPNSSQVSTVDDSSTLHSVYMIGQIGLYRDYGLNNYEGVYSCVIPDEHNINHTLMIAIYKEYAYTINSALNCINNK